MLTLKPVCWTLDEGIAIVRRLQQQAHCFGYHITIGGGVVNTGDSYKDLDLFILPMRGDHWIHDKENLLGCLRAELGAVEDAQSPDYPPDAHMDLYTCVTRDDNRRIDIFIGK